MIAALLLAAATVVTSPTPAASGGFSPEPQAGGYAVNVVAVFIRRTPTLPGPVIEEDKAHTLYKVIACQGGWCALDVGLRGEVGYLPADVLLAVPAPR